jgi:hypothetical protein
MATLNFDESIVLILFAQSIGTNPTQADIVSFDARLQKDFGSRLQEIMTAEGLEIDVHSRSLVLGCRPHMAGNTAAAQIRNACRYVLKAQQALITPLAVPGPIAAAAAAAPAALGRRRAAKTARPARRRTTKSSRAAKRSKPRGRARTGSRRRPVRATK